MISQTTEYALRAAARLASCPGTVQQVREIARATQVPASYLSKVLRTLARARLVESQPGPGGGFRLALDPQRISVLDVVNAIDPFKRIETCPLGLPEHEQRLCRLHRHLDHACRQIERLFGGCTLAALLERTPWPADLRAKGRPR
ncbi:MAG: HTH-type transcriptional repressor NsrR [Phycisphaerae bacterium]|nr:HTH-type transcriptional repressor NsrR [Phycisphaerae bacterium]